MRYAIFNKKGALVGTCASDSPESALRAHNSMLPEKGVRAEPLSETRSVKDAYVDFAKLMRTEYFSEYREYCSNAGDPGEACECCPELDKDGNEVSSADTEE